MLTNSLPSHISQMFGVKDKEELLFKDYGGALAVVGEERVWQGNIYRKNADGTWDYVRKLTNAEAANTPQSQGKILLGKEKENLTQTDLDLIGRVKREYVDVVLEHPMVKIGKALDPATLFSVVELYAQKANINLTYEKKLKLSKVLINYGERSAPSEASNTFYKQIKKWSEVGGEITTEKLGTAISLLETIGDIKLSDEEKLFIHNKFGI